MGVNCLFSGTRLISNSRQQTIIFPALPTDWCFQKTQVGWCLGHITLYTNYPINLCFTLATKKVNFFSMMFIYPRVRISGSPHSSKKFPRWDTHTLVTTVLLFVLSLLKSSSLSSLLLLVITCLAWYRRRRDYNTGICNGWCQRQSRRIVHIAFFVKKLTGSGKYGSLSIASSMVCTIFSCFSVKLGTPQNHEVRAFLWILACM